jgi:glutamate-ammonia-ligase adenylyltransferase
VEFFLQALQLLHAGKHQQLQERGSLRALDRLLFAGLITEREHRHLAEAYDLWRRIEHRLQLHDGRQTHLLPDSGTLRERLARHMGIAPPDFDQEVTRRRDQVRTIFETLHSAHEPGDPDSPRPLSLPGGDGDLGLAPLLDRSLPDAEAARLLDQAGFAEPARATGQLHLLTGKPWGPLSGSRSSPSSRLALPLLAELARSPDPDAALHHLVELTLRFGPYEGLWAMLDQNRATLRLLLSLFGSSDYLARLFINHPELLDQLLLAGRAQSRRSAEEMRRDLRRKLDGADPGDTEARLNLFRRFRNEEVLRIGMADISGELELEGVWEQLCDLAQLTLELIYPLVLADARNRYGCPRHEDGTEASMTVLGLGKLGAGELTYASDLDLIFIFSGGGATDGQGAVDNGEFFTRVAQRLIGALSATLEEGRLYEVDSRLRPSGNQGTLVTSRAAFTQHHLTAQLWERQVLIKARSVAGDHGLGRDLEHWIERYVYGGELDPSALRSEMDRHRRRMEKELADEKGGFYNLKLGRGGLLDVDFIAQYHQLCHGKQLESLRVRSSLEALGHLEAVGLMAPEVATTLIRGYRFLRRIESRLRIVRDRSAERLPADAGALEVMARRLGYRKQAGETAGSKLLTDYQALTESIRGIYERIFRIRAG